MRQYFMSVMILLGVCSVAQCQPSLQRLLEQAVQRELRVNTVEVELRVEVKRFQYTPEQLRQWQLSEELIQQAREEMTSLPETETAHLRMRFDNRKKLFMGIWQIKNEAGEADFSDWRVVKHRTLTNGKAVVNERVSRTKQGDTRRDLERNAPTWPPLAWQSEIWRYRIWQSHLPEMRDTKAVNHLRIEPITDSRQLYMIKGAKTAILSQVAGDNLLLLRYTVEGESEGYPEYEEVFTYDLRDIGVPYPSRVTITRYLVPPRAYANSLRIPRRTPLETTVYTVQTVRINPVLSERDFEEGTVAPGTFVQDNRFSPPLIYVQGNRQFSERDLFRMAQNRELLLDADWMGYRPRPNRSTYIYFGAGLVVTGIAVVFLMRTFRRRLE